MPRTSAAAIHAATMVMKHHGISVRPPETLGSTAVYGLQPTAPHLAIIIDKATNAYEVALVRPKVWYWQKIMSSETDSGLHSYAPQVLYFIQELIEALNKVPKDNLDDAPIVVETGLATKAWSQLTLSRAALEAARGVFWYYELWPLKGKIFSDVLYRREVAKLIDVSLGLRKAIGALPILRNCRDQMRQGKATVSDIRKAFRQVGNLLEFLPNYQEREDEVKLLV